MRCNLEIIRGKRNRLWGIGLANLTESIQNFIRENFYIKELSHDDRLLKIVLNTIDHSFFTAYHHNKIYYDSSNDQILNYFEVKKANQYIKWNCAICETEIKSSTNTFDAHNFVCKECGDIHLNKLLIDKRILDSSINFRKYCKEHLNKEVKKLSKWIKKSNKKDS